MKRFLVAWAACLLFLAAAFGCAKSEPLAYLKIDISDELFPLVMLEGKPYIDLEAFGNYLHPSKHRFAVEDRPQSQTVKLKDGAFGKEDAVSLKSRSGERIEDKVYLVKYRKREHSLPLKIADGHLLMRYDDAKTLFGWSDSREEFPPVKGGAPIPYRAIRFDDPDAKERVHANDRDYDWYMDQKDTGKYADGNCGPTSVAMVAKWLDPASKTTGESARGENIQDGQWWSTDIIEDFFRRRHIDYTSMLYKTPETVTDAIDAGDILLVCINTEFLERSKRPQEDHTGKFYDFSGGHFLLIKGYEVRDGKLYYQVYDPNSWGETYLGTREPLGKDRLYRADQMETALKKWWMWMYAVMPRDVP